MVVADNCARYVDLIWRNHLTFSGSTLVWGSIIFAFQIYGDFSGYSDMAIGIAKLFGIQLSTNFRTPYFSKNIADFWRRWHISLSTWFRDYIYIPLGGNRQGRFNTLRNVMIVFLLSGLWHGANWTFVVWGLWHGLLSILYILWRPIYERALAKSSVYQKPLMQSIETILLTIFTFAVVCFGWILFRAPDMATAWVYVSRCFSMSLFTLPGCKIAALYIIPLVILEWITRRQPHALHYIPIKSRPLRWIFYIIISWIILDFDGGQSTFIYFQF